MTELLDAVRGFFLAPPAETPAPPAAAVASATVQAAGLVAAPEDFDAAAGAVAATLRRRARAKTALVCRFGAAPARRRAATPAARALERRLRDRDLPAAAAGALCQLDLDDDPGVAGRDAWRVIATAQVPVVLALAGRRPGLDDVLAELDLLVLALPAAADPDLTALAAESLASLGRPVAVTAIAPAPLRRRRAALGLARAALEPAPA